MSERYLRMFSLPQNQYAAGSPVIVRAGVLLQDTMTDRLVGQIKFENISNRVISSMEVRLALLGANGNRLGECAEHRYLDAAAQPYAVFGAKEAISIEEPFAKGFCIDVIQVIFDDGTLWRSKEAEPFVSMPEPYKLEDALMSEELADEYRLNTTPKAIYAPSSYKDVWVCACGAYNKETEEVCHACGQTVETLSENLDPEELRSKRERRQMTWAPKARKHRKRPKLWDDAYKAGLACEREIMRGEVKMEEKTIIREKADKKVMLISLAILGALVLIAILGWCNGLLFHIPLLYGLSSYWFIMFITFIAVPISLVFCIIVWWMQKCEIVVTTHRVYGRTRTKRLDLPLDSISSVAMGVFRSVIVSTSSGRISFCLLKKQNKVFDVISTLLRERQNRSVNGGAEKRTASVADTLKEYKSLLDAGIITQEEFNAKKKQILGL